MANSVSGRHPPRPMPPPGGGLINPYFVGPPQPEDVLSWRDRFRAMPRRPLGRKLMESLVGRSEQDLFTDWLGTLPPEERAAAIQRYLTPQGGVRPMSEMLGNLELLIPEKYGGKSKAARRAGTASSIGGTPRLANLGAIDAILAGISPQYWPAAVAESGILSLDAAELFRRDSPKMGALMLGLGAATGGLGFLGSRVGQPVSKSAGIEALERGIPYAGKSDGTIANLAPDTVDTTRRGLVKGILATAAASPFMRHFMGATPEATIAKAGVKTGAKVAAVTKLAPGIDKATTFAGRVRAAVLSPSGAGEVGGFTRSLMRSELWGMATADTAVIGRKSATMPNLAEGHTGLDTVMLKEGGLTPDWNPIPVSHGESSSQSSIAGAGRAGDEVIRPEGGQRALAGLDADEVDRLHNLQNENYATLGKQFFEPHGLTPDQINKVSADEFWDWGSNSFAPGQYQRIMALTPEQTLRGGYSSASRSNIFPPPTRTVRIAEHPIKPREVQSKDFGVDFEASSPMVANYYVIDDVPVVVLSQAGEGARHIDDIYLIPNELGLGRLALGPDLGGRGARLMPEGAYHGSRGGARVVSDDMISPSGSGRLK